jgi:hypothetical protein
MLDNPATLLPGSIIPIGAQGFNWRGKVHIADSNGRALCGREFESMRASERDVREYGYCARCLKRYRQAQGEDK